MPSFQLREALMSLGFERSYDYLLIGDFFTSLDNKSRRLMTGDDIQIACWSGCVMSFGTIYIT